MERLLKQLLSRRQKLRIVPAGRSPAAVLLPLYRKHGEYYLLFIKRTDRVRDHKGQISFPGGNYEKRDGTLLVTALRECAEEIGLTIGDTEILGELDDESTSTSSYVVAPFVGLIRWPYSVKIDEYEVAEIIEIPVSALLDGHCREPGTETIDGVVADSYIYHYGDRVIWGATARILYKFLEVYRRALDDRRASGPSGPGRSPSG